MFSNLWPRTALAANGRRTHNDRSSIDGNVESPCIVVAFTFRRAVLTDENANGSLLHTVYSTGVLVREG
jgi:hypothetical protein